jgi:hypothetical protein
MCKISHHKPASCQLNSSRSGVTEKDITNANTHWDSGDIKVSRCLPHHHHPSIQWTCMNDMNHLILIKALKNLHCLHWLVWIHLLWVQTPRTTPTAMLVLVHMPGYINKVLTNYQHGSMNYMNHLNSNSNKPLINLLASDPVMWGQIHLGQQQLPC